MEPISGIRSEGTSASTVSEVEDGEAALLTSVVLVCLHDHVALQLKLLLVRELLRLDQYTLVVFDRLHTWYWHPAHCAKYLHFTRLISLISVFGSRTSSMSARECNQPCRYKRTLTFSPGKQNGTTSTHLSRGAGATASPSPGGL